MSQPTIQIGGRFNPENITHPSQDIIAFFGNKELYLASGPTAATREDTPASQRTHTRVLRRLRSDTARSLYLLLGSDIQLVPLAHAKQTRYQRTIPPTQAAVKDIQSVLKWYASHRPGTLTTLFMESGPHGPANKWVTSIFAYNPGFTVPFSSRALVLAREVTRARPSRPHTKHIIDNAAKRAKEFALHGELEFQHIPCPADFEDRVYNGSGLATEAYSSIRTRVKPIPQDLQPLFNMG